MAHLQNYGSGVIISVRFVALNISMNNPLVKMGGGGGQRSFSIDEVVVSSIFVVVKNGIIIISIEKRIGV